MQLVKAEISSGSMAAQVAPRRWCRARLRYGPVSTMPLARRTAATVAASTDASKSIVTMTCERSSVRLTNGVAYVEDSAQVYNRSEESLVRLVAKSKPPLAFIHFSCSSSMINVARAGVLYVWFLAELSIAVLRFRKSGTQRSVAAISSARSSAAGENSPNQSPPSEAKFFCGEK